MSAEGARAAGDRNERLSLLLARVAMADQRAFNDAVLKLVDDIDERIARLERKPTVLD